MNEPSLFTGMGGGVLGSKILGWRTIGYVEHNAKCQERIRQRMADGILDVAPQFGDIGKFISEGYAGAYSGLVDIVTAGFPCQPFSIAGKGLGASDLRNGWPSTIECLRIIRPRFALLENVPGLLTHAYMGRIFGDLAESGYRVRWTCLEAKLFGSPQTRERLYILAYRPSVGLEETAIETKVFKKTDRVWNSGFIQSMDGKGILLEFPDGRTMVSQSDYVGIRSRMADSVDRLKGAGNGQLPIQMAYAFQILSQGII